MLIEWEHYWIMRQTAGQGEVDIVEVTITNKICARVIQCNIKLRPKILLSPQ
jgi:hypothetical protein